MGAQGGGPGEAGRGRLPAQSSWRQLSPTPQAGVWPRGVGAAWSLWPLPTGAMVPTPWLSAEWQLYSLPELLERPGRPAWWVWTFPGQQEGGHSKKNGFSRDGGPDLGQLTEATPTLGDTVGLVAELAWLGLRPPWAGQAGQRAIVLWLKAASCMAASHGLPQGRCTLRAQPWPRGQANRRSPLGVTGRIVLGQRESPGASGV